MLHLCKVPQSAQHGRGQYHRAACGVVQAASSMKPPLLPPTAHSLPERVPLRHADPLRFAGSNVDSTGRCHFGLNNIQAQCVPQAGD